MYKWFSKGKKMVGIAQRFKGWNVSTFSVTGNKVKTYVTRNAPTLKEAKKLFTKQKRRL